MGLETEYSERRACQMTGCERQASWIVHVQWSVADFLDCECCEGDLPFTIEYWQRLNVDGVDPEIWADELVG